ncbi:MAG: type II secretion system protein [Patescibacteria group bacterium]|uniref:Type II secretion system protein n=1 Tax=candidate division WWE3 bacterium TaxID=2053526 RepID=A0A955J2H3_UNCKA|nr:type II secretion system protein [candidate division WWE3 bacterium]
MYSNDNTKSLGFTFIELIIVVSLVTLIFGVLLIAIDPVSILVRNRDVARIQDLEHMHRAMDLALKDNEVKLVETLNCKTCTSHTGTTAVDGENGWVKFELVGPTGLSRYIPALPMDPLNKDSFVYTYGATSDGYEFNAVLESPSNIPTMTTDGGNSPSIYEVGTSLEIL